MGIDAILAIGSLIIPPAVDFIRKKFLGKDEDNPEATMSTLATTKPDVLPGYVAAVSGWMDAQTKYFNRDIAGTPSQWIVDVRAAIRPLGTIGAGIVLAGMVWASINGYKPDPSMIDTLAGVRYSCEVVLSSWFGSRLTLTK